MSTILPLPASRLRAAALPPDHLALLTACRPGVALCTVVHIEGSFSRRLGAQLAVFPDGSVAGSLADGCLERQLASDVRTSGGPRVLRYGQGSPLIDFRLPCGGALEILVDPAPDRAACQTAAALLATRAPATLALPDNPFLPERAYIPALRVLAFGEGPELDALGRIAAPTSFDVSTVGRAGLALGRASHLPPLDRWTAAVLLFHDHEWEMPLLAQLLAADGFYIGAQGGAIARRNRMERLRRAGIDEAACQRIHAPIGSVGTCRDPETLALSILAELGGAYERIHPHHR